MGKGHDSPATSGPAQIARDLALSIAAAVAARDSDIDAGLDKVGARLCAREGHSLPYDSQTWKLFSKHWQDDGTREQIQSRLHATHQFSADLMDWFVSYVEFYTPIATEQLRRALPYAQNGEAITADNPDALSIFPPLTDARAQRPFPRPREGAVLSFRALLRAYQRGCHRLNIQPSAPGERSSISLLLLRALLHHLTLHANQIAVLDLSGLTIPASDPDDVSFERVFLAALPSFIGLQALLIPNTSLTPKTFDQLIPAIHLLQRRQVAALRQGVEVAAQLRVLDISWNGELSAHPHDGQPFEALLRLTQFKSALSLPRAIALSDIDGDDDDPAAEQDSARFNGRHGLGLPMCIWADGAGLSDLELMLLAYAAHPGRVAIRGVPLSRVTSVDWLKRIQFAAVVAEACRRDLLMSHSASDADSQSATSGHNNKNVIRLQNSLAKILEVMDEQQRIAQGRDLLRDFFRQTSFPDATLKERLLGLARTGGWSDFSYKPLFVRALGLVFREMFEGDNASRLGLRNEFWDLLVAAPGVRPHPGSKAVNGLLKALADSFSVVLQAREASRELRHSRRHGRQTRSLPDTGPTSSPRRSSPRVSQTLTPPPEGDVRSKNSSFQRTLSENRFLLTEERLVEQKARVSLSGRLRSKSESGSPNKVLPSSASSAMVEQLEATFDAVAQTQQSDVSPSSVTDSMAKISLYSLLSPGSAGARSSVSASTTPHQTFDKLEPDALSHFYSTLESVVAAKRKALPLGSKQGKIGTPSFDEGTSSATTPTVTTF